MLLIIQYCDRQHDSRVVVQRSVAQTSLWPWRPIAALLNSTDKSSRTSHHRSSRPPQYEIGPSAFKNPGSDRRGGTVDIEILLIVLLLGFILGMAVGVSLSRPNIVS
jgi:hypothetical protein